MSEPITARHLVALNTSQDTVPSEIHILPRGKCSGRDGRGPYFVDPARVIQATRSYFGSAQIPVDYEHLSERKDPAGPTPAAGWITALREDENGIFARVEWTAKAAEMIANREYRYLSPAFMHNRQGVISRLMSVGLVNRPNLDLKSLNTENATMSPPDPQEILRWLRGQLALPEDEDPKAVVEALLEVLDLPDLSINADATPDPTKWVPIGEYKRAIQELKEVDDRLSQNEAEAYVTELLRKNLLIPFQREWAISVCRANKTALDQFVQTEGPKVQEFAKWMGEPHPAFRGRGPDWRPPNSGARYDDSERHEVAAAMGLDPATMRTTPEEN